MGGRVIHGLHLDHHHHHRRNVVQIQNQQQERRHQRHLREEEKGEEAKAEVAARVQRGLRKEEVAAEREIARQTSRLSTLQGDTSGLGGDFVINFFSLVVGGLQ